jgi:hypothetical protein
MTEHCPICKFKGVSLRKHWAKKPECKNYWDTLKNQESIDATTVDTSHNDSHSDAPSDVWSDDDVLNCNASISEEDEIIAERDYNDVVAVPAASKIGDHQEISRLGFTVDQHCETKLLKILNDKKVPHSTYPEILEWCREAKKMKYSFEPRRTQRKAQVAYLTKWQSLHNRRPIQNSTKLPGKPTIDMSITSYDFKTELLSLLSSSVFNDINNLDLNPNDVFSKCQSPSGRLNCFNAGNWYSTSHDKMCKHTDDFFVPIIFSFDESALSNRKASIAPLKFTTSLLNQKERNKESNWRTVCFIPDLSAFETASERQNQSSEIKSRRLHTMFGAGMKSYIALEKTPQLLSGIVLSIAGKTKVVNVKIACGLIVGDIQGGDKICCRSASYKVTLNRACRKCNIPGSELSNLEYDCKKISMRRIKKLVVSEDHDKLRKYHQHCHPSTWYDLSYGMCKFGVFSAATPTEWLHALDNGIIEHCLRVLIEEKLSLEQNTELDELVQGMTKWPRQRSMSSDSNSSFPRLLWKNGITKLTELTADYKVGRLLTVVVISLTKKGKMLFDRALGKDKGIHVQVSFQKLLAYRAWLHKTEFWKVNDNEAKKRAKEAIKRCFKYLVTNFPRRQGQGWNLPKVHEQLHIPDDIERSGPPSVSFSGVVERQHVTAKQHCGRTRKNRETLDKETGERMFETVIINETYEMMRSTLASLDNNKPQPDQQKAQRLALSCICDVKRNGNVAYDRDCNPVFLDADNNVLSFVLENMNITEGQTFYLLSEITHNGKLYRANKNYYTTKSAGWFDWVMLRFAAEDERDRKKYQSNNCNAWFGDSEDVRIHHNCAPGRIIALLSFAPPKEVKDVEEEVHAVMETCNFPHKKSSLFSTRWEAAPMYIGPQRRKKVKRLEIVKPSSFVAHCLMIPEDESETIYHQLWDPSLWAGAHHKD